MLYANNSSGFLMNSSQDLLSSQEDDGIESSVETGFLSGLDNLPLCSLGLILVSILFLFYLYTELKFQYRSSFFKKCAKEVVDAPNALSPDYEGKLVYLVGKLELHRPCYLSDPLLPFVETTTSVVLKRSVEMLLWHYRRAFNAEMKWSARPLKSVMDAHKNPQWDPRLENTTIEGEYEVQIFPFHIDKEIIKMIPATGITRTLSLNPGLESGNCSLKDYQVYSDSLYYYLSKRNVAEYVPGIGDYRIKYSSLELGSYATVFGEYSQGSVKKYKNTLLFADIGIVSMDKIIFSILRDESFKQKMVRFFLVAGGIAGIILGTT